MDKTSNNFAGRINHDISDSDKEEKCRSWPKDAYQYILNNYESDESEDKDNPSCRPKSAYQIFITRKLFKYRFKYSEKNIIEQRKIALKKWHKRSKNK